MFDGQTMLGASLSDTVTVWVHVLLFPAASTTVQVTVVTPIGKVAGALFVTDATAQLSAVTGDPRATVAKQSSASVVAVMFDGQTMLGASLSDTVTVWVHVLVFPAASTTVQVTVVTPIGKVAGALFVTDATAQLSAVTGDPRATVAKQEPPSVVAVMFDGQTMLGASLSDTVTVWVHVVLFPAASTTVQVTVVTPIGKVAGASLDTDATAQLSAVTGDPRATVAKQSSASVVAVMFDGQTMLGASLSDTVTVWVHVLLFPAASTTVQVTVVTPIGKVAGASLVTDATAQLSAVTGDPRATVAKQEPPSVVAVMFDGQTMLGASLSDTVTVCVHVLLFPAASTTVKSRWLHRLGRLLARRLETRCNRAVVSSYRWIQALRLQSNRQRQWLQ